MKFEVGDNVVVKHSNENGKVVAILADKMVMVEVRGVKFPAYTDQLDFPYFKMFSAKKNTEEKKLPKKFIDDIKREKNAPKYKVAEGLWLLFFPVFSKDVFEDDVVEELKIYLVNQTDAGVKFHFWLNYGSESNIELQNEVLALQDFYLMNIEFEDLNNAPSFEFEFSLVTPNAKKAEYFEAVYKPKGKQVFKLIEALKQKGESFFTQQLYVQFPDKAVVEPAIKGGDPFSQLSKAGFKVVAGKRINAEAPPPSVLDLHIEKLTDDYRNMSSYEKLTLQLREFEKWLDKAELNYVKQMWVIHGVGSGKLKQEVHEILKLRSSVKSFVSQYHPWYGHGATEIYLK
ncbi:MAG TPA: Smr/MutS family protein [Phnomibacter sp.]|nr:Smr/MutS family protein [Phnomibacter sp.]